MRMKLNKSSQLVLVAVAGILAASLVTACSQLTQTLTVDFVYVASPKAAGSNSYGEIDVFEINSESGKMRQIPTSPFPSQGRNPVAMAVSTDYGSLFVVNQDDNTIVQFAIGDDGKLYPYNTVNTPGIFPMAVTASKSNLFVADLYEPLPICSDAEPCPGSISVFPLTAATGSTPTTMGSPVVNSAVNGEYWPLTLSAANASDVIVPTAIDVLASGSTVYVTAYDSSVTPNVGYVFAFAVGSGGVLTPLSGSPFAAGVKPSAIASGTITGSSSTFVYVTDFTAGNVLAYSVSSTTGNLVPLAGSPFHSGNQPSAIAVDTAFPFAYVANSLDGTVTGYSISSTGALTSAGTYTAGLQPVAIGIDPSTEHFVYVLNFQGDNLSGFELNETNGTLLDSQSSPFPTNANPTAAAAVPHNGTGAGIH
jgi:6-phosphogluconolactonase (cycloisomerase 2 family)